MPAFPFLRQLLLFRIFFAVSISLDVNRPDHYQWANRRVSERGFLFFWPNVLFDLSLFWCSSWCQYSLEWVWHYERPRQLINWGGAVLTHFGMETNVPSEETWKYIEQTTSGENTRFQFSLQDNIWASIWDIDCSQKSTISKQAIFDTHKIAKIAQLKDSLLQRITKSEIKASAVLKTFFLPFFSSCRWKFEPSTLNVDIFPQRFHNRRLINRPSLFTR